VNLEHDINCDFWLDFQSQDCVCGATRPRHAEFIPYKLPERDALDDQRKPAAVTAGTNRKEG
jgi:hypothetical protein